MKKIILNNNEKSLLSQRGRIKIERNGFELLIEYLPDEYQDTAFKATVYNPYDSYSIDRQMHDYARDNNFHMWLNITDTLNFNCFKNLNLYEKKQPRNVRNKK